MLLDDYRSGLADYLFATKAIKDANGNIIRVERTDERTGQLIKPVTQSVSKDKGTTTNYQQNFKTDANSMKKMQDAWNKNKNVQATRAFGGNKSGSQFGGYEAAKASNHSVMEDYQSQLADYLFAIKVVTNPDGTKKTVFTDEKTGKEIKPSSSFNSQSKGYTSNGSGQFDTRTNAINKMKSAMDRTKNISSGGAFGGNKAADLHMKHDSYGPISGKNHSAYDSYDYLDVLFNDQPQMVQQPNQQPQMVQDPNQMPQQTDQPQMVPQQDQPQSGVSNLGDPNANYYPGMRVVDDKGNAGTVRTGNKLMQDSKGQFTGIEVMWDSGKCDWISTQLVGMQVQEVQQDPNQQQQDPNQAQDQNQQQGTQQVNSSIDDKLSYLMSENDHSFGRRDFAYNYDFNPYSDDRSAAPGNVGQAIYKSIMTGVTNGITKTVADELSVTIPQLFDLGRTAVKVATVNNKSGNQAEIALQAQAEIQSQIERLLAVRSGKVITSDKTIAARKQHLYLH